MATRSTLGAFLATLLLALGVNVSTATTRNGDYIVMLRPGTNATVFVRASSTQLAPAARADHASFAVHHVYNHALSGFSATLSPAALAELSTDPRVVAVLPDETTQVADDPTDSPSPGDSPEPSPPNRPTLPTPGPDVQLVPTGIQRVGRPDLDGAKFTGNDEEADIDIAVVDTGVFDHPDLNLVGGVDCTGSSIGISDGFGHGTHVSGTAAARDNDFGVVGVAPGARIWSVKVLNQHGYGKVSWLLCGIDWIAAQRDGDKPLIEVANMSLTFHGATRKADDHNCGLTNHDPVHQAIFTASTYGTIFVVAAGNAARNTSRYRPGAYDEVITVSALSDFDGKPGGLGLTSMSCPVGYGRDRDDALANFSNFGPDVDIMAPGKCIWSTNKNGGYRAMSGTSMATPHVTGAVALYLLAHPDWTFQQVRRALIACGTDDWKHKSDHDKHHEPVLNLARLCPADQPD